MLVETASLSTNNEQADFTLNIILEHAGELGLMADVKQDVDLLTKVKMYAHSLFTKYIKQQAEYEINISGVLRERYTEYDDMKYPGFDLLQFVEIFDELIGDMFMYIRQSFFRFYISGQLSGR